MNAKIVSLGPAGEYGAISHHHFASRVKIALPQSPPTHSLAMSGALLAESGGRNREGALRPREWDTLLAVGLIPPSERPGPDKDGVWGLLGPQGLGVVLFMPSLQAVCSLRCHWCSDGQGVGHRGQLPIQKYILGAGKCQPCPPLPQEYERASKVDQFVTRFLLRETVSQLQALQSSLEGASDTLEAQAHGPRYVRCSAICGSSS